MSLRAKRSNPKRNHTAIPETPLLVYPKDLMENTPNIVHFLLLKYFLIKTEFNDVRYLKELNITTVESILCNNFKEIENIYQEFLNKKRKSIPSKLTVS